MLAKQISVTHLLAVALLAVAIGTIGGGGIKALLRLLLLRLLCLGLGARGGGGGGLLLLRGGTVGLLLAVLLAVLLLRLLLLLCVGAVALRGTGTEEGCHYYLYIRSTCIRDIGSSGVRAKERIRFVKRVSG